MRTTFILPVLLIALTATPATASAAAAQDTPDARKAAAAVYLNHVPMVDLINWMVSDIVRWMPAESQHSYLNALMSRLPWKAIEQRAIDSLSQRLTVDEINSLVSLVQRPEGKSALLKLKLYESDLMPLLNTELEKALQQTSRGK